MGDELFAFSAIYLTHPRLRSVASFCVGFVLVNGQVMASQPLYALDSEVSAQGRPTISKISLLTAAGLCQCRT